MASSARADLIYKAIYAGNDSAARNMQQDPKTKRFTTVGVKAMLRDFVISSGIACVKSRPETDEYWLEADPDDPWWYKVNIELEEQPERLFVKVKLVDPDENEPWAEIIGCHF